MNKIEQTYEINAPVEKVWEALVAPKLIEKWGAGPVKFDATEGGKFSMWGGDIHGTNTKIVSNNLLEQDWYSSTHPDHCYKVTFTLIPNDGSTTVKLVHADVPEDEIKDYELGWKDYYLGPMKELLEQ